MMMESLPHMFSLPTCLLNPVSSGLNRFAEDFFTQALTSGSLVHAYVLKGRDMDRMYRCALGIAKRLNCEQAGNSGDACGACPSCRWIERNAHPAVYTVSRLTYLVSDDGKELTPEELDKLVKKSPQTQIKTEQIGRLIHQLGVSSQYFRVVIFTDAEEGPQSLPSTIPPPQDWLGVSANEKKSFHLRPLTRHLFNANSANRFLKTLEEPPPKTLFFFLTDSEENLLETIVSRCQTVPFGAMGAMESTPTPDHARELYARLLAVCQTGDRLPDSYAMAAGFESVLVEELGFSLPQAIQGFQRYLREQHQAGVLDFFPYARMQRTLAQAETMLNSKTNENQVLNHLFWKLARYS